MKHIVALITIGLAVWASVYMAGLDAEVNKLDKITKMIKSTAMEDTKLDGQKVKVKTPVAHSASKASSNSKEMEEKLRALKERAGNLAAFPVSPLYKKQCASCHGNIGEGIIGPKLIGQDEEVILINLKAFKSGSRKNYVMYGLLSRLEESQLESLAKEIGTFQAQLDAANKK
jgi:cytochrome c553